MRILVVDDNRDLADTLAFLLMDALGPATVTDVAYDGDQGLKSVLAHSPAAVVMDVDMPVMSGSEAALLMRAALGASKPLLVAMTGRMPRDPAELSAFDQVMVKPVEIQVLINVVKAARGR